MSLMARDHLKLAPLAALVLGLCAADWYLQPGRAGFWALAGAMMAAIWLVVWFSGRRLEQTEHRTGQPPTARAVSSYGFLGLSAILAGLMLSAALGIKLLDRLGLGGPMLDARGYGVVMAMSLMVLGNAVPKVLSPLTAQRCSPMQTEALKRVAGWTFTLAGLVAVVGWIALDVSVAEPLSMAAYATSFVVVLGRVAWAWRSGSPAAPVA